MFILFVILTLFFCFMIFPLSAYTERDDVKEIGSRLELFVDDWLIQDMDRAELRLHHPTPKEISMTFDKPWEGNTCGYVTVFHDGDKFCMYYRGSNYDWDNKNVNHQLTCYAESEDGKNWVRPELNLIEFNGSKKNNIVWDGVGHHNFTPFKDANPNCAPDARYKALGSHEGGLMAFKSPDGLNWSLIQPEPVITEGAFDSQNLAFWDSVRGHYVEFHRGFRDGVRDIMTCTSEDFINWTEPQWIDQGDAPHQHLYTNATTAYYRAPHIYMSFPGRFMPSRKKIEDHPYPGVSDGVFMTSRDGLHWHRWPEAFVRPGLQPERWWQRNNYTAWGILTTKADIPSMPDELSIYLNEHYYIDGNRLRRFSLRIDGFASVYAPFAGGEMITEPLTFEGKELVINYSTSAAGSVKVEILDENGAPIPGFTMDKCPEIFGDEIEKVVEWENDPDLSSLAGKVIHLKFALKDADIYSLRFK
ncbi:hypothetical protein GF312_10645 [Candidatus Poribacteria bacterium]|nr:hypothetical protein [Candidatus Poribacteria bacterium]